MRSKKMVSLVLSALVLTSVVAGCSKKAEDKSTASNTTTTDTAKTDGTTKKTFTYWVPMHQNAAIKMKSYNENEMYKELEKRTGVHIEFIHPPQGQAKENFNLLIQSGDLPDMMSQVQTYPGGNEKAVEDGIYIKLNDLIDKNAPNYKKLRADNKELARQTMTDSGMVYAFYCIQNEVEPPWAGPAIRKDWLDDLKLPIPETLDEWETTLRSFKDKKKAEAPLIFPKEGTMWDGTILSAFGMGWDWYVDNNKITHMYLNPKFKDYLALMNKWYKEGLIDKDFPTRDSKATDALVTGGGSGLMDTAYGSMDYYHGIMRPQDPKATWVGIPYPSMKKGEKVEYKQYNNYNKGTTTVITNKCKDPAGAVKWLDYAYGKEGEMLFNWGVEGTTYKMENGKPKFTELITKNKDNLTYQITSWMYKLHMGPYLRHWDAVPDMSKEVVTSIANWDKAGDKQILPPIARNTEESKKFSSVMTEISTYAEEMLLKFITGVEPISKYDDFIKQIKKMGMDDALKIQNDAYVRYMNRK